jgi:predicted transposase YdaD
MSIFEYDEEREMELIRQAEKEVGIAEGASKKEANIIMHMYENNFTLEQIALATAKTPEEIQVIIGEQEPALV